LKVTQIYNNANNIEVLKDLARKMQIEPDARIKELEGILKELQ